MEFSKNQTNYMKKIFSFSAAILACGIATAQISNASFENWTTTGGYENPTGWDQLNSITSSTSTYTCAKGTPGTVGSSYMKLTSKTVTGMGVVPGISVNGILDMTSYMAKSGTPSAVRPVSLIGSWQYMGFSGDVGYVAILLSKWNTTTNMRDTVAFANRLLSGMVMSWGTFSIPLTYHSTMIPDSAMIILSASGSTPANNSYLYVDNLAFTGTVPTGIPAMADISSSVSVFPNPTSGITILSYKCTSVRDIDINVSDVSGRSMLTSKNKTVVGENSFPIDVSVFPKGIYMIKIVDKENTVVQKLIIQ
jgi:hypothetical protein